MGFIRVLGVIHGYRGYIYIYGSSKSPFSVG